MLNVFNLIQWCFNRLIPARSPHSEVFVNPRMATLTRDSAEHPILLLIVSSSSCGLGVVFQHPDMGLGIISVKSFLMLALQVSCAEGTLA